MIEDSMKYSLCFVSAYSIPASLIRFFSLVDSFVLPTVEVLDEVGAVMVKNNEKIFSKVKEGKDLGLKQSPSFGTGTFRTSNFLKGRYLFAPS